MLCLMYLIGYKIKTLVLSISIYRHRRDSLANHIQEEDLVHVSYIGNLRGFRSFPAGRIVSG